MKIKSRTLPHSLYRKLKDEIKRRERRVLELEATLQRITVIHPEHYKQLQNELATTTESLAAAEAQIASLLKEHAERDAVEEELRKHYQGVESTARYLAELNDHLEARLRVAYTTLGVIGVVSACTTVISALHYLPKVL